MPRRHDDAVLRIAATCGLSTADGSAPCSEGCKKFVVEQEDVRHHFRSDDERCRNCDELELTDVDLHPLLR